MTSILNMYTAMIEDPARLPIAFSYNGTSCRGLGEDFTRMSHTRSTRGEHGQTDTLTFCHTPSGAEFRVEACVYPAYGACEWTVWIENPTDRETGIFTDLCAIDMEFIGDNPVMKGIAGDCGRDMYKPYAHDLGKAGAFYRESLSGRPSHGVFPYFQLEYGNGGTFLALGWPGCWRLTATATDTGARITGGQHTLSTRLFPGESIRTPLVALVSYEGHDDLQATNAWRHWFIDCAMRRVDGKLMPPLHIDFTLSQGMTTERMLASIRTHREQGVPLDCYWMDAGWYTDAEGGPVEWPLTGSLMIDETRFPDRFVSITEELKADGGISLLWFEPEVVRLKKEAFLAATPDFDPSWMLGTALPGTWLEGQLLDIGDPACRAWLTKRILTILDEADITVYRQDFNVDPGPVWRLHDAAGRVGYTENRYVVGYLAFWDALIEARPQIWLDSCASGGGRNDLETMRRSIPAQISDYWDGQEGGYDERQATMMSVMRYFPYTKFWMYGGEAQGSYTYRARSCYAQMLPLQVNIDDPATPWEEMRRLVAEWRHISTFYYADFYPLTEWNNDTSLWRGFMYFDSKRDAGVAQLFRPAHSTESIRRMRLHGLNPDHRYRICDTDGRLDCVMTGHEAMEEGIDVILPHPLCAGVLTIDPIS